jgi:transcriptional regulator
MYLPDAFKVEDRVLLNDVMRLHSFATVISSQEGKLEATHLPLILDEQRDSLLGHFAIANPHWRHFENACEALMIFQGPHAYVSPSMYATEPNVPTWAYVVVHARGVPRLLSDDEAVEQMIAMVRNFDPQLEGASLEPGYVRGKARGIKAFEMRIEKLEGKFKAGQNKTDADRLSAGRALADSEDEMAREVGRLYLQSPTK